MVGPERSVPKGYRYKDDFSGTEPIPGYFGEEVKEEQTEDVPSEDNGQVPNKTRIINGIAVVHYYEAPNY